MTEAAKEINRERKIQLEREQLQSKESKTKIQRLETEIEEQRIQVIVFILICLADNINKELTTSIFCRFIN